jgi:uncharacterized protein (TIGR00730 family)
MMANSAVRLTAMPLKNICVFCGASPNVESAYLLAAEQMGRALVRRGIGLVYGGARIGMMGTIANSVLAAGGTAVGVMSRSLAAREVAHAGLSKLHMVDTMHERKTVMLTLSDAVVALPGGYGTLEELFEVLSWAQLGIHSKPCGLLNTDDFFANLLQFLDNAVTKGLLTRQERDLLIVRHDCDSILSALAKVPSEHRKARGSVAMEGP